MQDWIEEFQKWALKEGYDINTAGYERYCCALDGWKAAFKQSVFIDITVTLTKHCHPLPHRVVIISGGLAVWTGSVWLSKTGDDNGKVLTWTPKWWIPLIYDDNIR